MKIFDASSVICIVNEAKYTKIFDLCRGKGYRLFVPTTIFEELKRDDDILNILEKYHFEIEYDIKPDLFAYLESRYPRLHKGEIGVICCGLSKQNDGQRYICILDEDKARKIRENVSLRFAGTIGLLLWLKKSKCLTPEECQYLYNQLLNSRFRVKLKLLRSLLE